MRTGLVANDPVYPLHPQVRKEPVISLALPGLVVMASTGPMILCICSLWADVIDDSEDCLDLVGTGLLKLAWSD